MNFPNYFADAEASFKEADYIIVGAPYDKTTSFRPGAHEAPNQIRQASWNFESFDLRTKFDFTKIKVHDYGDLEIEKLSPKDMITKVYQTTKTIIDEKKFPIFIGGEHSITPGIIQAFPDDVAVLSLDAHLDYRDIYENEKYNHSCAIHRISDHIKTQNIAVLGVRSTEKEEYNHAQKDELFFRDAFEIKDSGLSNILKETKQHLKNKKIYLTLDIDVIDPAYAPGTSTPEPFGLTPMEIIECIESFSSDLIGFDIVEVCPPYDHGQTSLLAAKIIRCMITSF